jgi:hypothetical protein
MKSYEEFFKIIYAANEHKFLKLEITGSQKKEIEDFVAGWIEKKKKEDRYQKDDRFMANRITRGLTGEFALGNLFGVRIADLTLGHTNDYAYADLGCVGLDVGIKTSLYGNFPMVNRLPKRGETILTVLPDGKITLNGYVSRRDLKAYSSPELVKDYKAKNAGFKTAFYGFEIIKPFKSLSELRGLDAW